MAVCDLAVQLRRVNKVGEGVARVELALREFDVNAVDGAAATSNRGTSSTSQTNQTNDTQDRTTEGDGGVGGGGGGEGGRIHRLWC